MAKLGPIGTMALAIIAPYVLGPLMAGMSAASGIGATAGTAAGSAGIGGVAASTAVGASTGISGAVAKTMFTVGKALGTVGKTVTGALEGTLNVLGGGGFTLASQAAAPGINLGTALTKGAQFVANEVSSIMKMPKELASEALPGDGSWLGSKRDQLLGEPIFTSTGKLRAQATPLAENQALQDRAADIASEPTVTLRDEAGAFDADKLKQYNLERGIVPQSDAFPDIKYGDQLPEAVVQKTSYMKPIEVGPTPEPARGQIQWDPDPVEVGKAVEPVSNVGGYLSDEYGRTVPKGPSLLDDIAAVPGDLMDRAKSLPSRFVKHPIRTTKNLQQTVADVREFYDPVTLPKTYGSVGGGTGAALGIQQLAAANMDYTGMTPDQFSNEEVVFTNLISNDQALDQTLMDVLGRDFMFAITT